MHSGVRWLLKLSFIDYETFTDENFAKTCQSLPHLEIDFLFFIANPTESDKESFETLKSSSKDLNDKLRRTETKRETATFLSICVDDSEGACPELFLSAFPRLPALLAFHSLLLLLTVVSCFSSYLVVSQCEFCCVFLSYFILYIFMKANIVIGERWVAFQREAPEHET